MFKNIDDISVQFMFYLLISEVLISLGNLVMKYYTYTNAELFNIVLNANQLIFYNQIIGRFNVFVLGGRGGDKIIILKKIHKLR